MSARLDPTVTREPAPTGAARRARRRPPAVLRSATTPYGFTVALWISSTLMVNAEGRPGPVAGVLFAGGALLGFGAVGEALARVPLPWPPADEWSLLRALHIGPVLAAILGIALDTAVLNSLAAWFCGGLTVAVAYFGGVCVESRYLGVAGDP